MRIRLGWRYKTGDGAPKDLEQAKKCFARGATAGDPACMCDLGLMYERGEGLLSRDYIKAAEWYRKSAELGNAVAMRNLGLLYSVGAGVSRDQSTAVEWFSTSKPPTVGTPPPCARWVYL